MTCYADSDYATCPDTRRSQSGFVVYLGRTPASFGSSRQKTSALSSTEAEYVAAAKAVSNTIWLRTLLGELGYPQTLPTPVYEDNAGCIRMVINQVSTVKHIDIRHHFIRELRESKEIEMFKIKGINNPADMLTKSNTNFAHLCPALFDRSLVIHD